MNAKLGRMKEWAKMLLAALIGLLVALLLAESIVRLLPVQGGYFRIPLNHSTQGLPSFRVSKNLFGYTAPAPMTNNMKK